MRGSGALRCGCRCLSSVPGLAWVLSCTLFSLPKEEPAMMTVAEAIAEYTRMLDLLDSEPTYNKGGLNLSMQHHLK
jgi:hypothetical protein